MKPEEKLELIKRNCQEIVTEEELLELLKKKKQPLVYIGTAVTGKPHIAYFTWVLKLADFLKAGFKVKLLLADLHGALDNCPWDVLEKRYKYYSVVIPLMFKAIGADINNFEIIKGTDFQLKKDYIIDTLKLSTMTTIHDATKAASDVVKFGDNPKLSGLIYPLMQALDEEYLGVDVQYGGADQRKILMYARENLPKLGYKARVEVMTPIIPGLTGKKMSASDPKSKVDLLDDEKTVIDKIKKAYCEAGVIEDNGILAFLKHVIMTIKMDRGEKFIIERPEKFGGNIEFSSYEEIEAAFVKKELHPLDLKNGLAREINILLSVFQKNKDKLNKLDGEAYV
ncbi:MAG: tyrosine--tRNA ligase [Nanoarchaeota archaeon]|nr:tyrosine--tRNA ligase [Nanoarchaeota archaeon]MBU1643883.1 tyrosine--tRNA ligase [Nanoarchaeota archaeon]MBU1977206.1 tyrosine--tRNA ligase [Nanoarchaeota archaeon]